MKCLKAPTIIFNLGNWTQPNRPCFHSYQTTHKHSNITVRFHFRRRRRKKEIPRRLPSIHPSVLPSYLFIPLINRVGRFERGVRVRESDRGAVEEDEKRLRLFFLHCLLKCEAIVLIHCITDKRCFRNLRKHFLRQISSYQVCTRMWDHHPQ